MPVRFSALTPDWRGQAVYLIGGGPSLAGFDFERLHGKGIVVAVNDAMFHAPFANAVFTIDTVWLRRRVAALQGFAGEKIAALPDNWRRHVPAGVIALRRINAPGLSPDMGAIYTGGNSGHGALGMSLMRGAAEVYLLGFDMDRAGHFHGGYEWDCRFGAADYPVWAGMFSMIAGQSAGRVFNCNRKSAIRCFPFADIDEVLRG